MRTFREDGAPARPYLPGTGRIISNFFMSLDGVVEAPDQWHFPYFNDEMGAAVGEGFATNTAMLMGRTLYEEWADYWPTSEDEFAAFFNEHPKYVVTSTLTEATWNNTTVITGDDVREQLQQLRADIDGDLVLSGSATLVRYLLAEGLLDELRLLVHPIVVGHGQRLFDSDTPRGLKLVKHAVFTNGVLKLAYAPE